MNLKNLVNAVALSAVVSGGVATPALAGENNEGVGVTTGLCEDKACAAKLKAAEAKLNRLAPEDDSALCQELYDARNNLDKIMFVLVRMEGQNSRMNKLRRRAAKMQGTHVTRRQIDKDRTQCIRNAMGHAGHTQCETMYQEALYAADFHGQNAARSGLVGDALVKFGCVKSREGNWVKKGRRRR